MISREAAIMDFRIGSPSSIQYRASSTQHPESSIQDSKPLHEACQEFESVFIAHLLKTMRKTVPKADVMPHESLSEDIYRSMMDEALANAVARGSGVGLAEILYRQLSRSKKD
jgi:flagellar protein FlgJ